MQSILIRFTKKKHITSYQRGILYLSSLSAFWDIKNGFDDQRDVCEGIAAVVPKNDSLFPKDWEDIIAYDIRYRIEAYKYTNLLCFFRVDIDDSKKVIQLPTSEMNNFGNTVIVIKDEQELINRVLSVARSKNDICITGDVRYHSLENSFEPKRYAKHTISLITAGNSPADANPKLFRMCELPHINDAKHRFGCLDKYMRYANQKEWRICYLPKKYDTEHILLDIGKMSDIIDIIPATGIREYLLKKYPGYTPGVVTETRTNYKGTIHYDDFKSTVENIDGMCRMLIDIG